MKKILFIFLVLVTEIFSADIKHIKICAGAGLIKPINEIMKNFENENNAVIDIHYGGSGELFSILQTNGCDVFIPGAYYYTKEALNKNLVYKKSVKIITKHIPVLVVQKGNPKNIHTLKDLTRPDIKIILGDPRATAIGKVSIKILKKNNLYKNVKKNIAMYAGTVNQLLIYMVMGQADAAIMWEDMVSWAKQKGKLEVIKIPENENIIKTIPTAVGTICKNKKLANKFNNYLSSGKSKQIWKKWGFEI